MLNNAVAGIAEIINCPGLINVDFDDVRTVMAEMGMAMMGSASASGVDRARIAAEQAVACPLLEGVNLSGARGVLVNITASAASLKMHEIKEVMNTMRSFAADDATIIFGAVYDEAHGRRPARDGRGDRPRAAAGGARQQKPQLVVQKTGTDNQPIAATGDDVDQLERAGGDPPQPQRRPSRRCSTAGWTCTTSRRSCASRRTDAGARGRRRLRRPRAIRLVQRGPARRAGAAAAIIRLACQQLARS